MYKVAVILGFFLNSGWRLGI